MLDAGGVALLDDNFVLLLLLSLLACVAFWELRKSFEGRPVLQKGGRSVELGREDRLRQRMRLLHAELRQLKGLPSSDEDSFRRLSPCPGLALLLDSGHSDAEGNLVFRYAPSWRCPRVAAEMAGSA